MSTKYDVESFVNDILSLIQAGLPGKITAINAEKADTNSIDNIPVGAYYDNMGNQVVNSTIVGIISNTVGSSTSSEVTLAFSVIFNNLNQQGTIQKVLRYTRCLKEVVMDSFDNNSHHSNLKITEFTPLDIEMNKGSDFKIGGIQITATISG